jgi:hypothetical protein
MSNTMLPTLDLPRGVKDLTGQRFGRWGVISFAGTKHRQAHWLCKCECGIERIVVSESLGRGVSKSCSCLKRELVGQRALIHGHAKKGRVSPEFSVWKGMCRRCYSETDVAYKHYDGRGIQVCDRWRHGEGQLSGFECFLADMGERPSKKHTLDRWPDNDGNYEPSNCR